MLMPEIAFGQLLMSIYAVLVNLLRSSSPLVVLLKIQSTMMLKMQDASKYVFPHLKQNKKEKQTIMVG